MLWILYVPIQAMEKTLDVLYLYPLYPIVKGGRGNIGRLNPNQPSAPPSGQVKKRCFDCSSKKGKGGRGERRHQLQPLCIRSNIIPKKYYQPKDRNILLVYSSNPDFAFNR